MKKLIPAIALIAFLVTANSGHGQTENLLAVNAAKTSKAAIKNATKIDSKFINVKAKKDFVKAFRNVVNETWFAIPGGYVANFLSKGIDYRITYNDKGKRQYNQLIYSEEKLPFRVRDMVRSQYYDFDIDYCSEYQVHDFSIFLLTLKNPKTSETFKMIATDGEMEILADN
jgi:hypothetical protein